MQDQHTQEKIDDEYYFKIIADHTIQYLLACLVASSYEHEVDYELFLFDLLKTNEALLQPKVTNSSQEVEKDSCIFQCLADLFPSLPLKELVQQITMEKSHGQSKIEGLKEWEK